MSAEKFYGHDGKEIGCEDAPVYSYNEAHAELIKTLEAGANLSSQIAAIVKPLAEIFQEYLHWLYATPGEHATASQMINEALGDYADDGADMSLTANMDDLGTGKKTND